MQPCIYNEAPMPLSACETNMSHFDRLTPVPHDARFQSNRRFSEDDYTAELRTCERIITTPNIAGMFPVADALEQLAPARRSLVRMFTRQHSFDGMRYDFIQHYIAYHRSKIAEITRHITVLEAYLHSCGCRPPYPRTVLSRASLSLYQQQSYLLQQVLARRAGHRPHGYQGFHSVGQRFYDAVPGNVASVYRADAADRLDIQENGHYARGHPRLTWHDSPPDTPPDSP